jgi:hypothetical protein
MATPRPRPSWWRLFHSALFLFALLAAGVYFGTTATVLAQGAARSTTSPPPAPGRFPMPIADFLKGNYLERADIVLTQRKWDFVSWIIRRATNSPFSHAAMVFTGPHLEQGYSGTFVIEAGTSGVDLTKLGDYLQDDATYVAVKRFRRPWFALSQQSRVRGVMLDKIKSGYNYWAVGRIARAVWFGIERQRRGARETVERYRDRNWTPPNDFICSGFLQLGFVEAVLEFIRDGLLPPDAIKEVVFHPEADSRLPDRASWKDLGEDARTTAELFYYQNLEELETITPEDLARSQKLEWLYLIGNGKVHKVQSYDEARKLMQ